jgi:hypothetical protein
MFYTTQGDNDMGETKDMRRHSAPAVLDIGDDIGALVIYTRPELHGCEIAVSPVADLAQRIHTDVLERQVNGSTRYAALFLALPAGDYTIWSADPTVPRAVTITGSVVAELDWQASTMPQLFLAGANAAHQHGALVPRELLPPRYRDGGPVCTTPMGSAPMRYAADGQVAWDEMWTDFCDLALAGGPPHRGTLLLPASVAEISGDSTAYSAVVAEIARGLRLVTGLATTPGDVPGWVGLQCADEAMAFWLTIAIAAEQVSVRQAGTILYLPAGPSFRLESEIKNVITVVAKTHHYWTEHRTGS